MLLNCHTYFSLCYGTLAPELLIKSIKENGYAHATITDINNTSAIIDALRLAKTYEIDLSVGIDFRNGVQQQYIGIAKNNNGLKELNIHLSAHLHQKKEFETIAPIFKDVYIIYPYNNYNNWPLKENEFVGISCKELQQLPFLKSKAELNKMVILQTTTFLQKQDFNAHRLLRAIDTNELLSKLDIHEQASIEQTLIPYSDLINQFKEYPLIINNTAQILNTCYVEFEMGKLTNKNKKCYTQSVAEDAKLLRDKCFEALPSRYPIVDDNIIERLEKELRIIEQMNFASYFLINWDIINYAQSKDYFYVGRGSGANSMAAYLLRITDVDPIDLDLYFERFINPFRNNPPDFDIDFSWTDRDDITRYIFERFGIEHTALLGTYTTFQHDAVIRELGKVFGLPAPEIDKLQQTKDLDALDSTSKLVLQYSKLIAGMPNHLSIHASGIIISEEPICTYTATFMPPKGYPTTQFSMIEAEDIGLAKFDILSQRGLGKIKDAVGIIKQNKNIDIDIHQVQKFKTDKEVKRLLSLGKCIGCFYIESPAMRMLLSKLQADDYLRLVAASSIIRPGVSKSGMMNEYILRYRDEKRRARAEKELPELYTLLNETYGVMVYQEDVIKVGHFFAGLTLAEADYLRRGMSWKFKQRNEFNKVKENFFSNCQKKGYPLKTIVDIWTQIESFANYAFSKAHSASYAVESMQALYLKAYYPLEYMVATLNNGGGFYRTEFYVHEARMRGAIILPPCINHSDVICSIEDTTIYLGLQMINGLEFNTIKTILNERGLYGDFIDLNDFIKRTGTTLEQVILLIRVGAFNYTGSNKKELLWQAHLQMNGKKKTPTNELFENKPKQYILPELQHTWLDDAFDEIELLGFALCNPFKLLKHKSPSSLKAKDFTQLIGKRIAIVGYLVTSKRTVTSKGEKMYFGTFIDSEGDWIDTVHFPPSTAAYPFRGGGCYRLEGKVVLEFDFTYIDIEKMERLSTINRDD